MMMMIGQLAKGSGLSVRTLRFYANAGILPADSRSPAGYRFYGADALARARLIRALRELGVDLDHIKRVLGAEVSLDDIVTQHIRALDVMPRSACSSCSARCFRHSRIPLAQRSYKSWQNSRL